MRTHSSVPSVSLLRECDLYSNLSVRYFHKDHNAHCLPPKILYNSCFQFLLGIIVVPRKSKTMVMQNVGDKQGALWSM